MVRHPWRAVLDVEDPALLDPPHAAAASRLRLDPMRGPFTRQTRVNDVPNSDAQTAEIAALRRTLDEVAERQVDIVVRLEDIGRELVAAREERAAWRREHEALARRVTAAQTLIGRAYEQAQGWPERVAALRA